MKILQLYNKMPFPPHDGGAISSYNSTMGLLENGAGVTVLAMDQYGSGFREDWVPADFKEKTSLQVVGVDNRVKPLAALSTLPARQSYFVKRFRSGTFARRLAQLLSANHFDIILLEHLYLGVYLPWIREHSSAKVVLRPQNVEHRIWERLAHGTKNPLRKRYLTHETKKLAAFETATARTVDGIIALSEEDAVWFSTAAPDTSVCVVPIGFDLSAFPSQPATSSTDQKQPSIYHLGSMNWMPNAEGVDWFLKEVLPRLTALHPNVSIHLAGKHMPDRFMQLNSHNLEIKGQVPDALHYQRDKEIMMVPLLSGSGIRVKIIEGMALGKAIVTTTLGAEGLPVEHGKHLLMADTPEAFAEALSQCIGSKELRSALGSSARALAEQVFDVRQTGRAMLEFLQQVV